MTVYAQGHVKRDPETGDVAVRTKFTPRNERLARMAWLVATPTFGSRHAHTDEVAGWDDLYVPGNTQQGAEAAVVTDQVEEQE